MRDRRSRRLRPALALSFVAHAIVGALVFVAVRAGARKSADTPRDAPAQRRVVFLPDPRQDGGGGGGGDNGHEPARAAHLPGADTRTVPAARHSRLEARAEPRPKPDPVPQLSIPVEPLGEVAALLTPGSMEPPPFPTQSEGPGARHGSGDGRGGGDGPGDGTGSGPGFGKNEGGGFTGVGNATTMPRVLQAVKPQYTNDAMSARIQGSVWLECVVHADGSVGRVRVLRSLDPVFGLDREAMDAARRWRFLPATRHGEPVDVVVKIELEFMIR